MQGTDVPPVHIRPHHVSESLRANIIGGAGIGVRQVLGIVIDIRGVHNDDTNSTAAPWLMSVQRLRQDISPVTYTVRSRHLRYSIGAILSS